MNERQSDVDRRLIEDYLPIEAISAEASREKSVRKGHISTLHLWWARRPLVACRAAVYGALVPANRFKSRKAAEKFVTALCKYPGDPRAIAEAERHILEAHAERLTQETGQTVTAADITQGRAPRPKVLDMFAGGGAIPLEALRLGCDAYALDLNPVAHIIELCTLVYPQMYGKPDSTAKGCAKDGTWAGLAAEVEHWGQWVLTQVKAEIGDLYPPIPDPDNPPVDLAPRPQMTMDGEGFPQPQQLSLKAGPGWLTPVAYLWTRTVRCKNPACGATVPLVRQTWLCKKAGRYVALRMVAPRGAKRVRFEVVEAPTETALGFDPAGFSKGGNATCPFCPMVADTEYVKEEGCARRTGQQLMAVVCVRQGKQGKVYLSADELSVGMPDEKAIRQRIESLCQKTDITIPNEPINPLRPSPNARGISAVTRHGLLTFGDLFTPRQLLCLLTFAATVRKAEEELRHRGYDRNRVQSVVTYLAVLVNRQADYSSSLARWHNTGEKMAATFGRQALPMVWDFAELAPFGEASGGVHGALAWIVGVVESQSDLALSATVFRGSATALPWPDGFLDAIITDPPYYDNVPYADISDFFYVWLRRTIGHLHPEHFASELTPKKSEATALASRHKGDMAKATAEYETMMAQAFREAHRVLKPGGQITVVYAHKTTLGWSTLVDALRQAGFTVTEAWPLDTEMKARLVATDAAALASSIFLVARKRDGAAVGSYEREVQPELERIVRERVDTLWEQGIGGADLVIAAVGAGLRAFTRHAAVEYANGEEVPAEKFLAEVEGVVLETLLEKIFNVPRSGVAAVDAPSRFYTLWRYTYRGGELDAGEAIVFTYAQHVELDGPRGLTAGRAALVEKNKGKYRLRDYTERGHDEKLGLPASDGATAPLIDVLHRALYLMENEPRKLKDFLDEAHPDRERLRLLAQALSGAGLKGTEAEGTRNLIATTTSEQSALSKLVANWRTLVADSLFSEGR